MEEIFDNRKFDTMPVCELVLGNKEWGPYHFIIPSYQRGYRWEEKQVEDLLDDIKQFADDENSRNENYYLQPIVVKAVKGEKNGWEVIDGQQRLTTLLLILYHILEEKSESVKDRFLRTLYDIKYANRPNLDFRHLIPKDNIDSFYLSEAKKTIELWFEKHWGQDLTGIERVLLYASKRQAKFIWYPVDEESKEVDSISIFNRLNNGKISLTSSELIKALFILNSKSDEHLDTKMLAIEWDAIERKLQDDSFWYFISDKPDGYQTRIDLLFDFVTEKEEGHDTDYSYRKFQKLFDYCTKNDASVALDEIWKKNGRLIDTMEKAWDEVKRVYDRLLAWYEDNMYYHYIGFLIAEGETPLGIHKALEGKKKVTEKEWSAEDSESSLHELIREKFKDKNKYLTIDDIRELEYASNTLVRRTLLLFNVETCKRNRYHRFAFNNYRSKANGWDIEHVDSQNESDLLKKEDRVKWMEIVKDLLDNKKDDEANSLKEEVVSLLKKYETPESTVGNEEYKSFYKNVNSYFSPNSVTVNKNRIGNLTLLDSKTNRSYHDAPFPYKRQCIINIDQIGDRFIPICTRNLFLRYYSDKETDSSQYNHMYWTVDDMTKYEEAIINTIKPIFISNHEEGGNNEG